MPLTRRLGGCGRSVANEYARGLGPAIRPWRSSADLAMLFDQDMLGDDLEAWLAESALMKRTFRNCAIIAGLIERRYPGEEKSRRQMTISTDLVYDVLRKHQPDHLLLRAAYADAATGLLDIRRVSAALARVHGRITHNPLDHVSPGGTGDARDRPRDGLRRSLRRAAGRGRGGAGEGSDGLTPGAFSGEVDRFAKMRPRQGTGASNRRAPGGDK
jgi:hypothetical protein